MSKQIPEFGDVWEFKNKRRLFITCVTGTDYYSAVSYMDNYDNHHCTIGLRDFQSVVEAGNLKYIGKSIDDINQLFEVKKMLIKTDIFLGCRMRTARIFLGIELDDLSDKTKIEDRRLYAFEKGIDLPTKEEEKAIAKALLVDPKFFYQFDTSPITEEECTFSPRMKRS